MFARLRNLLFCLLSVLLAGQVAAAVNVGNFVWEDLDKDGVQDAGEPGVPGVTVQLWDPAFTVMAGSAVTNAAGNYQFSVPGGAQYRMRVILPYPGDRFTLANVGSDATDSDISPNGTNIGTSEIYNFAAALTQALSLDVGVIPDRMRDHNIGDMVFRDGGTGIQSASPTGRVDTTVQLMNPAGTVLQSMVTDATGFYSFKAPPGTYRLRFTHPTEIPTVRRDMGTDESRDSDIDRDGYTDLFTVAAGEVRRDIDAGFVYAVRIGNFVWNDLDRDGVREAGEPGLEGVPLELWDSGALTRYDSTTSGADGSYTLIAPGAGSYRVRAILPYPGDLFSPKGENVNNSTDSDINPSGANAGYTDVFTLASNVLSWDVFGVGIIADPMKDHTIGDKVFLATSEGLQSISALGRADTTVELMNSSGTVLQSMVTDATGFYSFKAPPGTYRLRFTHPENFPSPWKDVGMDDSIDSDIDEDGYTDLFTLLPGQVLRSIDAGFVQGVDVGDLVWHDLDGDGIRDAGEPGLAGVAVELWNVEKTRRFGQATTDAMGRYRMRVPGRSSYRLFVLRPLPTDTFSPVLTGTGSPTESVIIGSGEDFGFSAEIVFGNSLVLINTLDAGIILASGPRVITPFRVTGITPGSSSSSLVFTGPTGGTYKIDRSADMRTWTEAVAPFVSSASTVTRTVPVPAGSQRQFFRVRRTR